MPPPIGLPPDRPQLDLVTPEGTQTTTRGRREGNDETPYRTRLADEVGEHLLCDLVIGYHALLKGCITAMSAGVRPIIPLAADPTDTTLLVVLSIATTKAPRARPRTP